MAVPSQALASAHEAGGAKLLQGYAAIAATVAMWGYSAVAIKAVPSSGLVGAFYRLWFAIPLLWLSMLVMPSVRRRLGRAWLLGCLAGGSLFGVHQLLFFSAIKLTSVANVTIIGALQPVLVLLVAGPLFDEHLRRGALGWAGMALAGTALVVFGSAATPAVSPLGDAVAFANLFAFTAYFLVSRRIRAFVGAWEYVVGMTTLAGLVITAATVVVEPDLSSPSGWHWLVLLSLAVFPGTLGHVLTNWAHAHVTAFSISMMLLAVPVVASASAFVFLGESVTATQVAGALVVLAAITAILKQASGEVREELAESAAGTDAP